MKLVVNPPASSTVSTGSPCQSVEVPCWSASALMGAPASSPNEKQALITPENVATMTPFFRLNSRMTAVFCSADISFSFDMPALPANAMPAMQIAMPSTITWPECDGSTCEKNWP